MELRAIDNQVMAVLGIILLMLAVLVTVYYVNAVPAETSFGDRYVNEEIPLIFPFYVISSFKPITLITYLIFAGIILILETAKDRVRHYNMRPIRLLLLVTAFASGYELIWNFFAWFATWQKLGGMLDLLSNTQHQYALLPVNFNFATKISYLVLALSLYGSFFLHSLEHDDNKDST